MAAEEVRTRLRRRLAEEYGMDEADLLLDRPPGGWDDLVTKPWLHLELSALESRMSALESRMTGLESRMIVLEARVTSIEGHLIDLHAEMRTQTWRLLGGMTALLAVLVAAIKL